MIYVITVLSHLHVLNALCVFSFSLVFAQYSQLLFPFLFPVDHTFHHSAGGLGIRTAGRGLSLCDVTNLSPAACRKFSDTRCSTPVPARKRRCTMVVDYKEPSLNA